VRGRSGRRDAGFTPPPRQLPSGVCLSLKFEELDAHSRRPDVPAMVQAIGAVAAIAAFVIFCVWLARADSTVYKRDN
jgi:hypothetical protein